jgi:hypothetical protein
MTAKRASGKAALAVAPRAITIRIDGRSELATMKDDGTQRAAPGDGASRWFMGKMKEKS